MITEKPSSKKNRPYVGPERRKGERRQEDSDRRDKMRFEPEKHPRRSGQDRRKQSRDIWKDHNFD